MSTAPTSPDPDPGWWTVTDIAEHLGIGEPTWRGYVSRGFAPPPDDPGDPAAHPKRRIPRWRPDTIRTWHANRPRPRTTTT